MALNLDEYRARLKASEPGRERIQQFRAQIHEAVRATAVTGHPDWDHFLEKVEGRIAAYDKQKLAEQNALCDPSMVNVERIMAAKVAIVAFEAAAQALREIIDLPKMLIQTGAEASAKLKAMDLPE